MGTCDFVLIRWHFISFNWEPIGLLNMAYVWTTQETSVCYGKERICCDGSGKDIFKGCFSTTIWLGCWGCLAIRCASLKVPMNKSTISEV